MRLRALTCSGDVADDHFRLLCVGQESEPLRLIASTAEHLGTYPHCTLIIGQGGGEQTDGQLFIGKLRGWYWRLRYGFRPTLVMPTTTRDSQANQLRHTAQPKTFRFS